MGGCVFRGAVLRLLGGQKLPPLKTAYQKDKNHPQKPHLKKTFDRFTGPRLYPSKVQTHQQQGGTAIAQSVEGIACKHNLVMASELHTLIQIFLLNFNIKLISPLYPR